MRTPLLRRAPAAALALAVVALLAACGPVTPLDPSLQATTLSSDPGDTYGVTVAGGATTVTAAATNTGTNTRIVFWPATGGSSTSQAACATWTAESAPTNQEGVALLVHTTPAGATRAVTVTKNVWGGAVWVFNVHAWDTTFTPYPFTLLLAVDLAGAFVTAPGQVAPLPWRLCARVSGNTVAFLAWPLTQPAPSWGDPAHGGSAPVPAGWLAPGHAGWYAGHLGAGESVRYTDLGASGA